MKFLLVFISFTTLIFSQDLAEKESTTIPQISTLTPHKCIERIDEIYDTPTKELNELGIQLEKKGINDERQHAYSDFAKAQGEFYNQNYNHSTALFKSALPYFKSIENDHILRTIYNQLGNVNYLLRNDKVAFEYYQLSYELSKKLGKKDWIAHTFNNLGLVCHHQKDFKQAEFYYSSAADIYNELNDLKSLADVNYNRAMTYSLAKNNEMAEKYTKLSLSTYKLLNDIEGIGNSTYFLGQLSESNNNLAKSDKLYQTCLDLFKSINDSINQMPCLMKLAQSAIKNKNYKEAQLHIEQFKKVNRKINDIEGYKEILNLEYLLNKNLGNFEEALSKFEQLVIVKDSMTQLADAQKFAEMRSSFTYDIQELELSQLKENSQLHKLMLYSLALSILLILTTIYFIWRSHRIKEEKKVLMLEHKVLRTQMDPHFVFNIMTAIQFYILKEKPEDALDYINDFSSLLRLTLQYSKYELVTLSTEKSILDSYFALQNRRFSNKIKFSVQIDNELQSKEIKIPPMLAQPFIENSLKHAELETTENASIVVSLTKSENYIKLSIEDNGIGIEKSLQNHQKELTHKSMAISITNDRLKLMNINHKENVDLKITDLSRIGKRGTRVELMIPILIESPIL